MEEIEGYIGERHGVRVIIMRTAYSETSNYDMMKTAVELITEEL